MGAPKQRWKAEEEAALKAGIARYGAGKWSTILKDPEFNTILSARSNVDLKDKWRNMNVMANGWGSRQRARLVQKNNQPTTKPKDTSIVPFGNAECDMEIDMKPLRISNGPLQNGSSEKPIPRLENLILEAIATMKEPRGSSRAAIAASIEEKCSAPMDLERLLAAELKLLTERGKLIKVKHLYRIAPNSSSFSSTKVASSPLIHEQNLNSCSRKEGETNSFKVVTKAQIELELELEKMRSMSAEEAAAAAARAVAEAEVAIAEAEAAAREAEAAEHDAEVAKVFAQAALKALNRSTICT